MDNIEKALEDLRNEPWSEGKANILDLFSGYCLCCCTDEAVADIEAKLKKHLMFYGFANIANKLTD